MGSGFYIFCGVRWLNPDAPTDARLLADGLARLEAAFPHLRGATTLHRLHTVIRLKRSTWEQHLCTEQRSPAEECHWEECPAAEGCSTPPSDCAAWLPPALPQIHCATTTWADPAPANSLAEKCVWEECPTGEGHGPPPSGRAARLPPAWADSNSARRPASLLPGPDPLWAWYPLALPPTPRAPAAGAPPPADWPSPRRARPAGRSGRGIGGWPQDA